MHTLDVQFAPKVTPQMPQERQAVRGQNVTLRCNAEGNPMPMIRWARLDGQLPYPYRNVEVSLSIG